MKIDAHNMDQTLLNQAIRRAPGGNIELVGCLGQRFIGAGISDKIVHINGVPGNALGAYMDGGTIIVDANAQDATGDTMNDGLIVINGSSGDATGYSMRGGAIFVKGNAGYRAGIHMKAYQDKIPLLVIGGSAGSFLGEYQAGGHIVVLGLGCEGHVPFGYFCGTGMHGGKIFIRSMQPLTNLPPQVLASDASDEDMQEIMPYITEYCDRFNISIESILPYHFYVLTPNAKSPYKRLYAIN